MKSALTLALLTTALATATTIAPAQAREPRSGAFSCDIVASENAHEACIATRKWNQETNIGLHYGSMFTCELVIEVVRDQLAAGQGKEPLELLASKLKVSLQVRSNDGEEKFRELEPTLGNNAIVYKLTDRNESSFFVASVLIASKDDQNKYPQKIVQSIFGARAVALISAVRCQ